MKFLGIYFTANGQGKLIDGSIPKMFSHNAKQKKKKEKKKKRATKKIQAKMFCVSFAKFLRTCLVPASEGEHDETKLLHMISRLNKYYHWMIRYELFCQPVKMDT